MKLPGRGRDRCKRSSSSRGSGKILNGEKEWRTAERMKVGQRVGKKKLQYGWRGSCGRPSPWDSPGRSGAGLLDRKIVCVDRQYWGRVILNKMRGE